MALITSGSPPSSFGSGAGVLVTGTAGFTGAAFGASGTTSFFTSTTGSGAFTSATGSGAFTSATGSGFGASSLTFSAGLAFKLLRSILPITFTPGRESAGASSAFTGSGVGSGFGFSTGAAGAA